MMNDKILHAFVPSAKHAEVRRQVRHFILESGLQPGDRLPTEEQIAGAIGVSRTAVREGLRSLEAIGMIEARQGDGRYVRVFNLDALLESLHYSLALDPQPIRDLLEVREALEVAFIDRAMSLLTQADLEHLREIVKAMGEKAKSQGFFPDEDMAFHRAIFARVGNTVLDKILSAFWGLLRNLIDKPLLRPRNPIQTYERHVEILAVIEARDAERARKALRIHFDDIKERLRRGS
jgi:DNA-binding FadR family transcriptional regulator